MSRFDAYATVPVSHGRQVVATQIDLHDYMSLVHPRSLSVGSHGYVQMWHSDSRRVVLLHRFLLVGLERGADVIVDHINRDKLDNRRANLRVVSPRESNLNRGVSIDRELPTNVTAVKVTNGYRYRVLITSISRGTYSAVFGTIEEALAARDCWLRGAQ